MKRRSQSYPHYPTIKCIDIYIYKYIQYIIIYTLITFFEQSQFLLIIETIAWHWNQQLASLEGKAASNRSARLPRCWHVEAQEVSRLPGRSLGEPVAFWIKDVWWFQVLQPIWKWKKQSWECLRTRNWIEGMEINMKLNMFEPASTSSP